MGQRLSFVLTFSLLYKRLARQRSWIWQHGNRAAVYGLRLVCKHADCTVL